jgi:hypothetical protein
MRAVSIGEPPAGAATHLTLDPEEASMLRAALESHLSDLRMEIARTDAPAFRNGLKRTETLLRGLLDRLG